MEFDESDQLLMNTRFWIQRVFVPIAVFIGVGGNVITVMVLTRRRMRCSTNIYLTALAIADIVYLIFTFVLSFAQYDNIHSMKYAMYWRFNGLSHWLCDAASSSSVWLTVSFTLERYIAVCHPIRGKVLCTENRAKSIVIVVIIWCFLTTASTTFEYQLDVKETCLRNCTLQEQHDRQLLSGNIYYHNTTIHYLPSNDIVVTKVKSSDPETDHYRKKLVNEIFSSIHPKLKDILPINCTSHPHIIYVPIYTYPQHPNRTNTSNTDNRLIDSTTTPPQPLLEPEAARLGVDGFGEKRGLGVTDFDDVSNDTCCEPDFKVNAEGSPLRLNETYMAFIYWYSAIGFGLLPLALIATFNTFLIVAVYKSQRKRRQMTNSQENASLSNENRITIMLIVVVILFLICQTPTASILIYNNYHTPKDKKEANVNAVLGNVFNLMLAINASCNFLLYCVLSKKYRTTFRSLFCERSRRSKQDTLLMSSTRYSSSYKNPFKRNTTSEYRTPRNLETQSLASMPRSKSLLARPPGKAKSTDIN